MNAWRALWREESGQAYVEYLLLAVVVVLALILGYKYYYTKLRGRWIGTGNKLFGATDNCGHPGR